MKLLVTGGSGFIGKNIRKTLEKYDVTYVSSKDYDLKHFDQVEAMFRDIKPQTVLHLAAKVGGILYNKSSPADFWFTNMSITTNMWELSKKYVEKMVYVLPGCAYPQNAAAPMKETSLWDGTPDHPAYPGAMSKKMGLVASYAYRKQHGLKSCILIPCNLFGEHDSFDENNSHVVTGMIGKFHRAKTESKKVVLWGSGVARRDLAHVSILDCLPYFIENDIHFDGDPLLENVCNISTGKGTTIKELAETVAEVVGYEGEIEWDTSKPEGALNKFFCNERMKNLGIEYKTPLVEGISRTYAWFKEQI